jgi:hypothetical protein
MEGSREGRLKNFFRAEILKLVGKTDTPKPRCLRVKHSKSAFHRCLWDDELLLVLILLHGDRGDDS